MNPNTSRHNDTFSIASGICIQQQRLAEWSRVLTAEAFAYLFREATKDNHKARDGYDICRGDSLQQIINNFMNKMVG